MIEKILIANRGVNCGKDHPGVQRDGNPYRCSIFRGRQGCSAYTACG